MASSFTLQTYVPLSKPWRQRREFLDWLDRSEEALRAEFPEIPPMPRSDFRKPGDILAALDAMQEVLVCWRDLERKRQASLQ